MFDVAEVLGALRGSLTGAEPPSDILERIGGWGALEAIAPSLVDESLLTPVVSLLARDVARDVPDEPGASVKTAAFALTKAVLDSTDPLQFAQNLDTLCATPAVADLVGTHLAARCLEMARPIPTACWGSEAQSSIAARHAAALEALARLTVQGFSSKYKLLGLLEEVTEPQPVGYARAVIRAVSLAFDHWAPEDEVASVIDTLTGVTPSQRDAPPDAQYAALTEQFRLDIAPDALWARSNIELARALRSDTREQVLDRLTGALAVLETAAALDARDDVQLLQLALRILCGLLQSMSGTGEPQDASDWNLAAVDVAQLEGKAEKLAFDWRGLHHWSGDRKIAVLQAWKDFLTDLARLRDHLRRDSLYDVAVALDDILAIYRVSRGYDVTSNSRGVERVMHTIRPAIAKGFASRAGLLRNLTDHVEFLATRATGDDIAIQQRLSVARTVLTSATESIRSLPESPGKPISHEAQLPPLLAELLGPKASAAALKDLDSSELAELAAAIADRTAATDRDPDLIVTRVRKAMLKELSASEDFVGDVVDATTSVLDQLIRFVARRMNTQESSKAYLFKPDASEHDLHADLYDWLSQGQLSNSTNVEVQEVGAGRVDIQIQFSGFHLYLELKVDGTTVPVLEKNAYIKQTVTYQATDVRIGFLVVLRLRAPKDKAPSPHLTDYVTHTIVPLHNSASTRHVVMLEVPGNQTKPSSVR